MKITEVKYEKENYPGEGIERITLLAKVDENESPKEVIGKLKDILKNEGENK